MAAYRNAALGQESDGFQHRPATFDFYHLRARRHDLGGIAKGFLRADLEGAEGHVADDEGVLRAACHAGRVIHNVAQRYRQRRFVPLQHVTQRIADQQRIDAGAVEQRSKARVVAGQHGDPLAFPHHLVQIAQRDTHGCSPLVCDSMSWISCPG